MADLEYSPALGGFVLFGTVATATARVTPQAGDALFIRQTGTVTLASNLAGLSLTIGGLAGQHPVVTLPEGAVFAGDVKVLNGGSLALGTNLAHPNANAPARLGAALTVAAGGAVSIVDGQIAGTLTPTGRVDIRNNATLTASAHLALASLNPPLGLTSQATGTLSIAGALDTETLLAVLGNHDAGHSPLFNGTLRFAGTLDNTGAFLPLDSLTGLQLGAAHIIGGIISGGAPLAGVTLDSVDIVATMTVAAGTTDTIAGSIGGFGTIAVDGTLALAGGVTLDATTLVIGSQGAVLGLVGGDFAIGGFSAIGFTGPALIDMTAGGTVSFAGTLDTGDYASDTLITWTDLFGAFVLQEGGLIRAGGGAHLVIDSPLSSSGVIQLAGGTLEVTMTASLGEVDFTAPGDTLVLDARGDTAGLVDFADGATILVAGAADVSATLVLNDKTLDIIGSDGTLDGQFVLLRSDGGSYGVNDFSIGIDGDALTLSTTGIAIAACFAAGTAIMLEDGPCAIEAIAPGQRVRTASGPLRRVIWTGRRRVGLARHPRPWDVNPVRIAADAFGPGLPLRDLVLSPDHAVFHAGRLIPARYLVNGATVVQEGWAAITYHHIELASHDVILAEGLPCETYLDTGNRAAFEGEAAPLVLHPDFSRAIWAGQGCAPLATEGAELAALRETLHAHAEALGHCLTADPLLRQSVTAGGIRLTSRSFVPAEIDPRHTDRRRLGVAVTGLTADGIDIALDDPRLGAGWHEAEPGLRWTTGQADIAVPSGTRLAVRLGSVGARYWVAPEPGMARSIHR